MTDRRDEAHQKARAYLDKVTQERDELRGQIVTVPRSLIDTRDREIHDLRNVLARVRNLIEARKATKQALSVHDILAIYQWVVAQASKDYR